MVVVDGSAPATAAVSFPFDSLLQCCFVQLLLVWPSACIHYSARLTGWLPVCLAAAVAATVVAARTLAATNNRLTTGRAVVRSRGNGWLSIRCAQHKKEETIVQDRLTVRLAAEQAGATILQDEKRVELRTDKKKKKKKRIRKMSCCRVMLLDW